MPRRSGISPNTESTTAQADDERSRLLLHGRACYERCEWNDAFAALKAADEKGPLSAMDLHRLAWSAGLVARDEDMLATMERVYHARLEEGEQLEAARAAFWLGFRLMVRGDSSAGSGWLSRAQRLVELQAGDCVERGYLLLPAAQRLLSAGESIKAHDCALQAAEIGARFAEPDLIAFARNLQARAMFSDGQIQRALTLMDEAMVAATAGELSPVVTGLVYCTAIASCRRVFALDRVREWTAALASWCEVSSGMVHGVGRDAARIVEAIKLRASIQPQQQRVWSAA
jgi:hypothetical protein